MDDEGDGIAEGSFRDREVSATRASRRRERGRDGDGEGVVTYRTASAMAPR